jgi:two-component system, sensor histidine kinase PdtaS
LIRRLKALFAASSLGVRLGSTIILALMPLGVLSVMQTRDALKQVDASTLSGVGGAALQAVREQVEVIKEAQVSARILASVLGRPSIGGPSCVDQVRAIQEQIPQATMVAFAPASGIVTCTSDGKVYDLSQNERFQKISTLRVPGLEYDPMGSLSKQPIVGVRHPVFDQQDTFLGYVGISLSYQAVSPVDYSDSIASWSPTYIVTFTTGGEVLVATQSDLSPEDALPGDLTLAELAEGPRIARFIETSGGRHIVSSVSVARDLFVASVWSPSTSSFWTDRLMPYLLPVLTWVAALVAAAFASTRLVVRHVRALSRSMSDYVTSRTRMEIPDLGGAPSEIQRLHAAYEGMIRTIEQEEAELQNLVVDKDLLLREVSHRSGNSLQIIASIMRLYRREASDPKLRSVLDGLINRVIALSSTHTSLYALSGQRDVAVDVVLSNVVRRLKEIHGVALGVASKQLEPVRIDSEAAIPLALALAEAIGCYFSRGGLRQDEVLVALTEKEGIIHLSVQGPEVPELRAQIPDGLSSLPQRMLRQFAAQISGSVSIRIDGGRASVDLAFPRTSIASRR